MYNRNKMIDNRTHLFDMFHTVCMFGFFILENVEFIIINFSSAHLHPNVQGPTVLLPMTTVIVKSNQRK